MISSDTPPKRRSLAQTMILSALFLCAGMFLLYRFGWQFLVSQYPRRPELLFALICLVLVASVALFLIRRILSPLPGLVKKAETLCDRKDGSQVTGDKGLSHYDRLGRSLDLLAQELKGKEEKIRDLHRRLLALNVIAAAVNQPQAMDRTFDDVLETLLGVTDFDWGIMYLLDEEKKSLGVKAWRGIEVDTIPELDQIKLGEGIIGKAAAQDQVLFIPDVEKECSPEDNRLKRHKVKSSLAVPFAAKGEIFGMAALGSFSQKDFSLEENEFMSAVGQQVGMAIDNTNLLSSWAKKAKDLSLLLNISYAVSSSLNLNQVLEVPAQQMAEITEAKLSYMALLDEDRRNLKVEALYSAEKGFDSAEKKVNLTLEVAPHHREVLETGKMVKITREDQTSDGKNEFFFADAAEELILMPLRLGQRILGIAGLGMSGEHRLDLEKLNLCQSITSQTAVAIENAQLHEYLKQRVNEIYTIYNVGQSLSTILDLDQLLDEILRVIVGSFGYLNCAILLVDDKTNELYVKASRGFPDGLVRNLRLGIGEQGIAGWVAHKGQPLVVGDVSKEPRYIKGIDECRSEVSVPLKLKDRVIGVLDAESDRLFAFTQKDVRILSQLASQIAITIENSRLFEEEKKRSLQLALINDVGRRAVSTLYLDKLLERVTESVRINFKYNHVSLFLMDLPSGDLVMKTFFDENGNSMPQGFRLKLGMGMAGWAAKSKKTFLSNDVSREPRYVPTIQRTKSVLCVPLKSGEEVLGVLNVESFRTGAFDDRDVAVLETLADFLTAAMNNVKLYEETKKKAHRLALTDQINRAISSTLDLENIFKIVSEELRKVLDYDKLNLAFWRPQQHCFELELTCSRNQTVASRGKLIPAQETSMHEVVKTKRLHYVADLSSEDSLGSADRSMFSEGIRSYLAIPILNEQNVIAVLNLQSKEPFAFEGEKTELVRSIGGHLSVAIKNARLFSDLGNAYESLKRAQDRLIQTEKLRAVGEMASGVVHDFNNILTSILGRTQLTLKKVERRGEKAPEDLLRSLRLIEESASDGTKILSRIQKFTKAKKDTLLSPVDLNQVVEDSLEMAKTRWQNPAIRPEIRIDVKKNLQDVERVLGDATELREVVTNLIINAVDAMPEGGTLSLRTEEDERFAYFRLSDTGIGMTQEVKNRIFEPFFTTKGNNGTGLGMSLVYNILSRHDGQIEIESSPGRGSTFTVKLPKCKGELRRPESADTEDPGRAEVALT
jgi:GAF domain-containing protein/two-component sensor histidine kinase